MNNHKQFLWRWHRLVFTIWMSSKLPGDAATLHTHSSHPLTTIGGFPRYHPRRVFKRGYTTVPMQVWKIVSLGMYAYIHTYRHYIHTLHTYITYITLHYITLHYHYITITLPLHYITITITLPLPLPLHYHYHYITLHYVTLHYITLPYIHTYIHTYIHIIYIYNTQQTQSGHPEMQQCIESM